MKNKFSSKEAYVERLRELAEVHKPQTKKNDMSMGTLIDFKKAADGIAYGIIKENHKYFIKKGGLNENPDISDFSYIGGLANKTLYQYPTLASADKNRNMILQSIHEGSITRFDKTGKKMILESKGVDEDAEEDIKNAENKLDDLDVATEKEISEPEPESIPDPADDLPNIDDVPDLGGEEGGEEMPDLGGEEGGEEMPDLGGEEGGEEMPDLGGEEGGEGPDAEDIADPTSEIETKLGKLTNLIRKTELTDSQVKSYMNSFIAAFKEFLPDVEIEDRKVMANKILKVVDLEGEENEIGDSIPDEVSEENELCNECGEFTRYAESMGYDNESIKECDVNEIANLISGYANAHNEGLNEGDFESVSAFSTPAVVEALINEYGHTDYVEKLSECLKTMNEASEEDILQKIDELNWSKKPPVVQEGGVVDPAYIEAQPQINEDEKEGEEVKVDDITIDDVEQPIDASPELEPTTDEIPPALSPEEPMGIGEPMGMGGAPSSSVDVSVDGQNKQINISMNEEKLRKYIKMRIEEKRGLRKPKLDESKKAPALKKLDEMIDQEYKLNETEQKVRKYVRTRLEEKLGMRKSKLDESKKPENIKKLDKMIDEQYELFKSKNPVKNKK
jgi:hypothetical protein